MNKNLHRIVFNAARGNGSVPLHSDASERWWRLAAQYRSFGENLQFARTQMLYPVSTIETDGTRSNNDKFRR
jgi:hypothetical protein